MKWMILLPLALVMLAGCATEAARTYSFDPPTKPGGRMCVQECDSAQGYCRQLCNLNQRSCVQDVQTQALRDYDKYTLAQFASHEAVELHLRDFERMTPCDDAKKECTNKCEKDYRSCYEGCGGSVSEATTCQFMCF